MFDGSGVAFRGIAIAALAPRRIGVKQESGVTGAGLCQSTCMREDAPFDYPPDIAQTVEAVVNRMASGARAAVVTLNVPARR